MKNESGAIKSIIMAALFSACGVAHSDIIAKVNGGPDVPLPTEVDPGFFFTFQGPATLSQFGIPVQCDGVTLCGFVTERPDGFVHVDVIDGSVKDTSGFCPDIEFFFNNGVHPVPHTGTPIVTGAWNATAPESSLPLAYGSINVSAPFTNVQVSGPLGPCGGGSIAATFNNNGAAASSFTFNGSLGVCGVSGTLTATSTKDCGSEYGLTGQGDIDIWRDQ